MFEVSGGEHKGSPRILGNVAQGCWKGSPQKSGLSGELRDVVARSLSGEEEKMPGDRGGPGQMQW